MAKRLVLILYADFAGALDRISPLGARSVQSILPPLKRAVGEGYFTLFSSLNRNTIDTATAIADGLEKRTPLRTRYSLYSDDWSLYSQFYKEVVARPEDGIVAVGHKAIVEGFPSFLMERAGEGWRGSIAEERRCCQGYVYDLAEKTWKLFPEEFKQ